MNESDFTPEEEQQIDRTFAELLDEYAHTAHRQKVEIIERAFRFARQAHQGVRRLSGEPYILHPLAVARIVVKNIGLGSTSICSALLHDVVEDTAYTVEDIATRFNPKIAQIVDGLTKISGGVFGNQSEKQAYNIRKLIISMSADARVVLVKLADRLHNMRTLESQPVDKQIKIARETSMIYAPLAHRLGLFPIKDELEDLSFRYLHPAEYAEISEKLSKLQDSQQEDFNEFIHPIETKLKASGYTFTITDRVKTVYSIWEKMQKKNIPFEDVYDLLAVRIVFHPNETMTERDQCWMIYSAISNIYRPHPERIRDWISTPKANGYEALHVTVMSKKGQWIEVQIRSERMHELAERGLAAHWKYKADGQGESELDAWLEELRQLLGHPDTDAMSDMETLQDKLYNHEIFVFTPKGDIMVLPEKASVLDFAYQLHSNLGEHCIGAKVNRKTESISYGIHSGDQIEILTSENQKPEPEWLNMVVSAKAKTALKRYFNGKNESGQKQRIHPYPVTIVVRGNDKFGVLVRILNIVSNQMHLYLKSMHAEMWDENNMFECRMGVLVYEDITVSKLCEELQKIEELTSVEKAPT